MSLPARRQMLEHPFGKRTRLNFNSNRIERGFTIDDEHAVVIRDGHLVKVFIGTESRGLAAADSTDADHGTGDRFAFRIEDPSFHLLFRADFGSAWLERDVDWFIGGIHLGYEFRPMALGHDQ